MLHGSCRSGAPYLLINCRYCQSTTDVKSINKILVANRGSVAIRIFAACGELGIKSVAIHSYEDRVLSHKLKADESYLVGMGRHPVKAYMNINEIIKICMNAEVDAVHPGRGFLADSADFAQTVIKAGMKYIGPPPAVIKKLRNKVQARAIANSLSIPTMPGTEPIRYLDDAQTFLKQVGVPVIVKPVYGARGIGIRVLRDAKRLNETLATVVKIAREEFGDGSVYLEKFLPGVRHIEVQIVADMLGNAIHIFDRDCSIQRRFNKICEIAPAPNLLQKTRDELFAASLQMAKRVQYESLGSFEFLVDAADNYYFLDVNTCLAEEHPVTEEITGIDLVQTQIKIAEGRSLKDYFKLDQDKIVTNCCAIQCKLTTEDPQKDFTPHFGTAEIFRLGAGAGIRFDPAHGFAGAKICENYDPLILKVTARAYNLKAAARKMGRTLKEYRMQGVQNNIPFVVKLVENKDFQKGNITTEFLAQNPSLFEYKVPKHRAHLLLTYLGDIIVNGPSMQFYTDQKPQHIKPVVPAVEGDTPPQGFRQLLKTKGSMAFIKAVKDHKEVLVTDTTFRDAHQSLLLARVRTYDLLNIAPFLAHKFYNLFSIEMWGGATFDVALRFLHECPWQRLIQLRQLIPNIPFQMLLRGASTVGYFNYPDNVVYRFCYMAAKAGIDIFRIFDALNYLPNIKLGMDAASKAGGIVETAIMYTGDVGNPEKKTKYTLKYYLDLAETLIGYGTHILCIKDTAALLKPKAAHILVTALKEKFPEVPIHVHTHDTSGNGVATLLAAAFAGADIVDTAIDTMSGITSQPSMGAVVASLKDTDRDTKLNPNSISKYSAYWEQTRTLYTPFECTSTMKSGNSDVYVNEIPGSQYISLQFQAYSYGSGDYFEEIKKAYTEANMLLGNLSKAVPTSTVVGDLAHFMVQNKLSAEDILERAEDLTFPASVVGFFLGAIGEPYLGYPEPLRTKVIKGLKPYEGRPGASLPPLDFVELETELTRNYDYITSYDVMSAAIFPTTARTFFNFRAKYGPVDKLPTRIFLVGPSVGEDFFIIIEHGKTVEMKVLAVASNQTSDGRRQVFYKLNGSLKVAYVLDKKAGARVVINPKADKGNRYQIGSPMHGVVTKINVKPGDVVEKRFPLLVMYAMKMDTTIFCPFSGIIKDVHVTVGARLDTGDLLITLE